MSCYSHEMLRDTYMYYIIIHTMRFILFIRVVIHMKCYDIFIK